MADFTQTVTGAVQLLGGSPTTKWNEFDWGEANWGEGTDLVTHTEKVLASQDTAITIGITFDVTHIFTTDSTAIVVDTPTITLVDAAGYNHVFRGDVTNADDRSLTSYTEVTRDSISWSAASEPSTTWSEI